MSELLDAYVDQAERDDMFEQYVTTALWSSNDESTPSGGYPMDRKYSLDDIHPDTLAKMRKDCEEFYSANLDDIRLGDFEDQPGQAGHDFWLTRNGSGAGFWDGDWPDEPGERLSKSAKSCGEFNLYIGDDGKIHGA